MIERKRERERERDRVCVPVCRGEIECVEDIVFTS